LVALVVRLPIVYQSVFGLSELHAYKVMFVSFVILLLLASLL
jgi:hypothetical protein